MREFCHLWQHGWGRGHHAKWDKSDREGQIPYDIIYVWNTKELTHYSFVFYSETQSRFRLMAVLGWG